MTHQLSLFLPGSCVQFVGDIAKAFSASLPDVEVIAERVSMTGVIADEVLAGASADVFLSANERYIELLRDAGLVPRPVAFARNRLALFVRPEVVDRVRVLDDLLREDVRTLVFPADKDPGGAYTVELFARAGIAKQMTVQQERGNVTVLSGGGATMSELLDQGVIDALIAYRTLDRVMPRLQLVDLPEPLDMRDRILFMAGAVVRDSHQHPSAQAFVDFLSGPEGAEILATHGFLPVT